MSEPSTAPPARPSSVATPASDRIDSPRPCARCGAEIPKPRKGQKACSSRCRWALWKMGRRALAETQAARDQETRAVLEAIAGLAQVTLGRLGREGPQ
jgi:predicted nucleic acid-binding Zn ribbon protein